MSGKTEKRSKRGRPPKQVRPRWQDPDVAVGGVVAIVVLLVAVFLVFGGSKPAPVPSANISGVVNAVTGVSSAVTDAVGTGGQKSAVTPLKDGHVDRDADGKLRVIYVGAEYCPFCAAERWSLIVALSRFGTFAHLSETTSSSTDVYPNTATFSFHGSTYESSFISFSATETEDRNGQPFESPSAYVAQLFSKYDVPPYVASAKGIPFLYIGGTYLLAHTGYLPQIIQGLDWEQISGALKNANDSVTKAIVGHANELTAAMCAADGNKADICSDATIAAIEHGLAA